MGNGGGTGTVAVADRSGLPVTGIRIVEATTTMARSLSTCIIVGGKLLVFLIKCYVAVIAIVFEKL